MCIHGKAEICTKCAQEKYKAEEATARKEKEMDMPTCATIAEMVAYFGKSQATIYRWLSTGKLTIAKSVVKKKAIVDDKFLELASKKGLSDFEIWRDEKELYGNDNNNLGQNEKDSTKAKKSENSHFSPGLENALRAQISGLKKDVKDLDKQIGTYRHALHTIAANNREGKLLKHIHDSTRDTPQEIGDLQLALKLEKEANLNLSSEIAELQDDNMELLKRPTLTQYKEIQEENGKLEQYLRIQEDLTCIAEDKEKKLAAEITRLKNELRNAKNDNNQLKQENAKLQRRADNAKGLRELCQEYQKTIWEITDRQKQQVVLQIDAVDKPIITIPQVLHTDMEKELDHYKQESINNYNRVLELEQSRVLLCEDCGREGDTEAFWCCQPCHKKQIERLDALTSQQNKEFEIQGKKLEAAKRKISRLQDKLNPPIPTKASYETVCEVLQEEKSGKPKAKSQYAQECDLDTENDVILETPLFDKAEDKPEPKKYRIQAKPFDPMQIRKGAHG